ncbi:hypothetical protein [Streptomyces fulvorobeus]|uniref:Integral membrane protein n=1 Tax=Streptomyces fulvorobeus TaxID=284028 RepID=A0A7J0C6K1_9ACTN|nr:hypothetical protein [Streptomyces fulvorobeus]NYE41251.1 hypothetical protein [Streptomyces fulvorobeus]GFM97594.1 hypothetical protein Sfulv_24050 [Streptomyces fulvorobeus]
MHGHGYPPPEQSPKRRPSPGALTALRVLFVALTVLSCGLLGWAAMLRLALVTRRRRDWGLLALVAVLNTGLFAFIMAMPEDPGMTTDAEAFVGVSWIGGVMVGVIAYYLYAEIHHYGPSGPYGTPRPPRTPLPAGQPPAVPARAPGYGYPAAAPPRTPAPPVTTPPPAASQRLDQVRAELDELSDYLRKAGEGR